jgi:predicted short-subunit dehydrogenase-like oxidoreductase (DUF2520 family)
LYNPKNCTLDEEVMRLNIGFIGAGKVGKALGLYFKHNGLKITGYCSRSVSSAREAASLTGSQAYSTIESLVHSSEVLFITVPDQAIEELDGKLSDLMKHQNLGTEETWIHVSGAYPSGCLAGIQEAGCPVGSMHPLQCFGEPVSSAARLKDTWFTIEGTEKAQIIMKAILEKTCGKYNLIGAGSKPLYHAGACVVSNYLVTLLESGIRLFEAAGMTREHIIQAVGPLIEGTLSNIREKGTVDALTGPIVRGDLNTVNVHLKAIAALRPSELNFYKSMGLKTTEMIENTRLTTEQTNRFQMLLEDTAHVQ